MKKGRVLIWKDYRGEVRAKRVMKYVASNAIRFREETEACKPILGDDDGINYISITHSDLIRTFIKFSNL